MNWPVLWLTCRGRTLAVWVTASLVLVPAPLVATLSRLLPLPAATIGRAVRSLRSVQVLLIFEAARAAFPGAAVQASTFEAFVDVLAPHACELEVVTGEIGDTWIHGVASDPVKIKDYRAMMRMRSQCLYDGGCVIQVRHPPQPHPPLVHNPDTKAAPTNGHTIIVSDITEQTLCSMH